MAEEESPLFVGMTNRDELRRSMLECSKGILESLKGHENFKNIRERKLKMIGQLRDDIKGISRLINTLRTNLPKVKDTGIKKPEVKKAKEVQPKMVKVEKPKSKTELEKLEAELGEIESKLNSLN